MDITIAKGEKAEVKLANGARKESGRKSVYKFARSTSAWMDMNFDF